MIRSSIVINEEFRHELMENYKELSLNFEELRENIEKIYDKGLSDDKYSDKLRNHVDDVVIKRSENKDYFNYVQSKKDIVESNIKESYKYNVTKVEKIMKARNTILRNRIKKLSLDNIGTAMNVIRDLYHDVSIDFERNKKNTGNENKVTVSFDFATSFKFNPFGDDMNNITFDLEEIKND